MSAELACAVLSYRNEPFLVEAVSSILEQEVVVEVVVVNSGGGPVARRLAEAGLSVPVIEIPHRLYTGGARNLGIAHTRAPVVAFLAADCLAMPGWAAGRLAAHRAGAASVASVLTNADRHSATGWAALLLIHHRRLAAASRRQRLLYSRSYDRHLFDRLGLFRDDLPGGEDTEFHARIDACCPVVLAPDVITAHRYPTTLRALLIDAFQRGDLQARMQGALESRGPRRLLVASRGRRSLVHALLAALRSPAPDRGAMLRAWPLAALGSFAYVAGALIAPVRRDPAGRHAP